MKYSTGFRNSVLRKVLPPNNRSVSSVAREYGISSLTIHNWLSRIKEGKLDVTHESSELPPAERSIKEKYRILLESRRVSEEDRGGWLRQQGLHSELARLRKENKKRRKQARRDQVAMAEALALLTLKKKPMPYGEWPRRIDTNFHQANDGGSCFRSAESRGSTASEL